MVDWTILSPTFLAATLEWVETVLSVLALGSGQASESRHTCHSHPPGRRS
jgi:hypothetical protein